MPRYTYRGGRGVRATYRRRLARPTVGVVPALLFFSYISQGPGNRNHTFQPLSICSGSARFSKYASRIPSPEISGGRGVAGVRGPSVGQPFLLTFIYFPAQGNALSRQVTADRARSLCVFFCCTVSDGPGCPPFGGMHGGRRNGQGLRRRQPGAVFPSRPSETIRYIPYRERPFAGLWVSTNAPPQRVSLSSQGRVSP